MVGEAAAVQVAEPAALAGEAAAKVAAWEELVATTAPEARSEAPAAGEVGTAGQAVTAATVGRKV